MAKTHGGDSDTRTLTEFTLPRRLASEVVLLLDSFTTPKAELTDAISRHAAVEPRNCKEANLAQNKWGRSSVSKTGTGSYARSINTRLLTSIGNEENAPDVLDQVSSCRTGSGKWNDSLDAALIDTLTQYIPKGNRPEAAWVLWSVRKEPIGAVLAIRNHSPRGRMPSSEFVFPSSA
ncbi:hypothetical protein B0H17DRAFT_1144911 [Mycena rosella]|uniref:Uncharacterized protein n=1 Tax=Mycena rosella TaxID=1033263 RepID=A0AAD7G668_MYCRO|nr:hypothetical protein B0H17DRAFT_1144911 [Mycena rosella]